MSKVKATKNIDQLLSSEDEQPKKKVAKKEEKAPAKKKVQESTDSSEESVEFIKNKQPRKESNSQKANNATAVKKPVKKVESDSDDESSEEVVKKPAAKAAPAKAAKKVESDSESEEVVKKPAAKAAPAKAAKKVESDSDDESEEEVKKPAAKAAKKEESDEEIEFKPQFKAVPQKSTSNSGCTELFVKNLPWAADENVLYEFFGKYGTVNNVKVLYDKMTGKARGLAFIEFSTRDEAQSAIDKAESLVIEGRNLQVSFSDQKDENRSNNQAGGFNQAQGGFNRGGFNNNNNGGFQKKFFDGEKFTAFVGNLGFKTTEQSVGQFFGDCGNVVDVRIAKSPEDGRSKGYCHVDFDSNEALTKALAKAGQNLDGRDVRVDTSTPRQGGGDRKLNLKLIIFIILIVNLNKVQSL